MKRILTALILSLAISSLFAVNLDLTVTSGDFELYDAYGHRSDPADVSDLEGLIVLTNDEEVTFSTLYGDITLEGGSIFSVLSLDIKAPTFYLVAGEARFDLKDDMYIQVYTPVTLTAFDRSGSYRIITTDAEEAIYNYSETATARSLDALSGTSYTIEPMTYSSQVKNVLNMPLEDMESREEEIKEIVVDVVEQILTPGKPSIISVEKEYNTPSMPELYVTSIYMPPVPEAPTLTYSYNRPEMPSLIVNSQKVYGNPDSPAVEVSSSRLTIPNRPHITDISYNSELLAPTVSIINVEKKTLTQ